MGEKLGIKELKEIIVDLRMNIIEMRVGKVYCPYSIYAMVDDDTVCGELDCDKCQKVFFNKMRGIIESEVADL